MKRQLILSAAAIAVAFLQSTSADDQTDECIEAVQVEYNGDNTDVFQAVPEIFTTYDIEEGTLNGRVHYISGDGKVAIAYSRCGKWLIQPAKKRGQCFGYAFSGSRDKCPIKAGKWKYFFGGDQGRSFKVAGEGLVITTVPERNVPTCDAAGAGASSVAFDTIRDKDFQKEIWALAKQLYGSGGRAFLKVNMPEYVVLDGEVKGGLDADSKFFHFSYHVHVKSKNEADRFRLKLEVIGMINKDGLETRTCRCTTEGGGKTFCADLKSNLADRMEELEAKFASP